MLITITINSVFGFLETQVRPPQPERVSITDLLGAFKLWGPVFEGFGVRVLRVQDLGDLGFGILRSTLGRRSYSRYGIGLRALPGFVCAIRRHESCNTSNKTTSSSSSVKHVNRRERSMHIAISGCFHSYTVCIRQRRSAYRNGCGDDSRHRLPNEIAGISLHGLVVRLCIAELTGMSHPWVLRVSVSFGHGVSGSRPVIITKLNPKLETLNRPSP